MTNLLIYLEKGLGHNRFYLQCWLERQNMQPGVCRKKLKKNKKNGYTLL